MTGPPASSYLICATPRSGSTLLCEALATTKLAGYPAEYFLPKDYDHWCGEWGVRGLEAFLDRALLAGTTPNGIFGAKVMWGYFDSVVDGLAAARHVRVVSASLRRGRTVLSPTHRRRLPRAVTERARARRHPPMAAGELLASVFPGLIHVHITRRDKVRQAISRWKLRQTRVATLRSDEPTPTSPLRFSYSGIDRMAREMRAHDAAWEAFFEECGITPISVVYEDLAGDPDGTVRAVLATLGITAQIDGRLGGIRLRRQADDISEQWYERYQVERAHRKRRLIRL
jgi:trehalose 2-sulfotransferase